ncbi:hypothetical protein HC752_07355 [Vibrio sp. S9_S30]|uniref:hypothetical protein n=1 Tax=Vibrio sp. S9_S30 TaxID=2720226 RepID=UPI0016806388|nr:hypothetical protein [Vibrio sp. S9_S30]MBD1556749.1 hypothetical protein [Vibrio sp. S9_S30]
MKYIVLWALILLSFNGYSGSRNLIPLTPLQNIFDQKGPWSSEKPKCQKVYEIPSVAVHLTVCEGWGMTTKFERDGNVLLKETEFGDASYFKPYTIKTNKHEFIFADIGDQVSWGASVYNVTSEKILYLGYLVINPGSIDSYETPELLDIIEFTGHGDKVNIRFTETHHDFDEKGIAFNIDKDAYYYELTADSIVKVENKKSD